MYSIDERELLRLYSKLNAQNILITVCFESFVQAQNDPAGALDWLRVGALQLAERQEVAANDSNPEFAANGRAETLGMVTELIDSLKKRLAPRGRT